MTISLQFLGAARQVTGSKHLLTVGDRRVLLECGMVQGPRRISDRANRDLPSVLRDLDAVILSHAHIDHSGSLPRLVKLGYRGPIHCTDATADLVGVLLADSAELQAADARYLSKKGRKFEPPYDSSDVGRTLGQLRRARYHERVRVCEGVELEFLDAGHILGSAMVVLDVTDGRHRMRIAFTGDHGRREAPILRNPEKLPPCDVLITESTYGNRLHESNPDIEQALARIVQEETRDGGRILVPAFAVGRSQHLVLALGNLFAAGEIPEMQVYVDSPMSTKATKIMAGHPEVFDKETRSILESGRNPFFFDRVRYVADVEESMSLNGVRHGVIISASGMCEGGRILHHLKQSVGRAEDCVLAVGYMAHGTLGRKLVDGYEYVKIFGERYRLRCKVRSLPGLSAHADYSELLASLGHLADSARRVFIVHGEEDPALALADRFVDAGFGQVDVPVRGEKFVLAE